MGKDVVFTEKSFWIAALELLNEYKKERYSMGVARCDKVWDSEDSGGGAFKISLDERNGFYIGRHRNIAPQDRSFHNTNDENDNLKRI